MPRILTLLAIVALCAGCKPPEGKVIAISPSGETVPLTQIQIDVEFDRPMRAATITSSTFYATGAVSGKHSGALTYPAPNKARLTVSQAFTAGERVTVMLLDDIKSTSGKYLDPYAHTFTMFVEPVVVPEPFLLESVSPPAEIADIARFPVVQCNFSGTYNPFTITAETVRLEGERSGIHAVNFENRFTGITQLRMSSDRPFLAGERISVCLSEGVTSVENTHLTASTFSFVAANDGSTWPAAPLVTGPLAAAATLHFLDADGDGRDEWVLVEETGAARIGEFEDDVIAEFTGNLPGSVASSAVGDFDGDGRCDLACLSADGTKVYLVRGKSNLLTFLGGATEIDFAVLEGAFLTAGHVDADGIRDLVVGPAAPIDGALVLWGSRTAPLSQSIALPEVRAAGAVALGDFDGDFATDLAFPRDDGKVAIAWGLRDDAFGETTVIDVAGGVAHIIAANLDTQSPSDLLCTPSTGSGATLLAATGARQFEAISLDPGEATPASAVVDWDGDGHLDLLTPDAVNAEVRILRGTGSGVLNEMSLEPVLAAASALAAGDIDGDGVIDLGFVFGASSWEVSIGIASTPPIGDTLRIGDLSAAPGAAGVEFLVEGDHENALNGFTIAFTIDPLLVTVEEFSTAGTDAGDVGVEFEIPSIDAQAGEVILGVIFDLVPPYDGQQLAAGSDHTFARGALTVSSTSGNTTTEIALANGIGTPPTDNAFVIGGFSLEPALVSGTLTISGAPVQYAPFVRGDANGDNAVDLGDPITLENYLLEGGTEPWCFDAADANDDGFVNLADPSFLLTYLFSMGSPPPLPFPGAGQDPTSDPLLCPISE